MSQYSYQTAVNQPLWLKQNCVFSSFISQQFKKYNGPIPSNSCGETSQEGNVLVCASTVPPCQHGQGANRITAKREPCHTSMPSFDYLQRNLDGTKGLNMIWRYGGMYEGNGQERNLRRNLGKLVPRTGWLNQTKPKRAICLFLGSPHAHV